MFDEDEVDEIFVEAAESYSDTATIAAYTRVIGIRRLMASASKMTDYTQNQSQEKLSQVFDHLKEMLKLWQDKVATADGAAAGSAARFGGLRQKPKRLKEYPDA